MGDLGEKFGTDWVSADNNMRDILKLIDAQCDGICRRNDVYARKR